MRRCVRAFGLLTILALVPAQALGQEVALGWNDTGPASQQTRTFDCSTNSGEDLLVASFIPPARVTALTELEAVIDFCSGEEPLPDYWRIDTCRAGAITVSTTLGDAQYLFEDYWEGRGAGTVTMTQTGSNSGRLVIDIQLPLEEAGPLTAGQEYYAFVLHIDHSRASGAEACAGCSIPLCIVLNDVRLVWPEGEVRLHGGVKMTNWQADLIGCPFVVPVSGTTWSGIKTLFD